MEGDNKYYLKVLSKIPLFTSLSEVELGQLMTKIQIRSVKKGLVVLNHEDSNNFMYIVLAGVVKVFYVTEDGKEILLAHREAGEYFSEMSLIDNQEAAAAEVSAIKNSVIALINKETFHSLLYSNPQILKNLLEEFTRRLRATMDTIQMFGHDKVEQRSLLQK
jgi:CRP-like cAMP-binding protein